MSTVSWVAEPSSSTLSEPRRPVMVPLSTTVTFGPATCWPMSPVNAEVFLRLKSASRPWPTASWRRIPGQPGPRTTCISPAGAGTAPSWRMAPRAASLARLSGLLEPMNWSRPARPPGPRRALGGDGVFFGDDEDVEAAEGLGVAGECAVASGDEDALQFFAIAGADLDDAGVIGACGPVGAQDQLQAGGEIEIEAAEGNGGEIGHGDRKSTRLNSSH